MARVRRKASATMRWNFEIAGLAAFGVAVLLGVALVLPPSRAGIVGAGTARALHHLFGAAAALFPILIALLGAIIFLEINVPRMIASLGGASLGYFLVVDTAFGPQGGVVGAALSRTLRGLVGDLGTTIVLTLGAIIIGVAVTNVSATPGPGSLREAFSLPAVVPKNEPRTGTAQAVVDPPKPAELASEEPDEDDDYEDDEFEDDDFEDEDDEFEDDELEDDDFEDDEFDDEDEDDEFDDEEDEEADELEEDEARAPAVVGEYQPASTVGGSAAPAAYRLPDLSLFDPPQIAKVDDSSRAALLEDTLASFGVGARVQHIERGPAVTRYELRPERGVKISRISALADDLALALAATSVRIEAPIPGKSAVGIEVPNAQVSVVAIREILEALPQRGTVPPLWMALGKDITGRPVFGDLGKMPHLLVAGATGSGKSVCLNGIIASLLVSATPDQVQLLMIDPKRVELTVYNGIPHLIKEVITDARLAAGALFEMTKEMDARYERFAKAGVRKIEEYNAKFPDEKLPYVVIVIDELADLMLIAPAKVETTICRIAQLARAT